MRQDCLDIGTIQAFLDGETAPERSTVITDHIAVCDDCALLLSDAEEENALVLGALDREMNSLVPTQRLWSRINDSIGSGRASVPFWQRAFGFLSVRLLDPSFSVAAGLLLFVAVIGGIWSLGPGNGDQPYLAKSDTAAGDPAAGPVRTETAGDNIIAQLPPPGAPGPLHTGDLAPNDSASAPRMVAASDRVPLHHRDQRATQKQPEVRPMTLQYLPGEESYIKTIEELRASVDSQKDHVLPPSSRVAFERDLAVVNDAIKRMQDVVRKNPQNQAARQVLYAAYQDKIDLLSSVGQREELMASLR